MYVIIWEYMIKPEHAAAFEEIYAANGTWAQLFKKHAGYLSSELLHDPNDFHRYITIDRWRSSQDYQTFLLQWKAEYTALEAQCDGLTEQETLLGKWESVTV
jgi:heme-degrading monooxygenase HmoA